VKEKVLNDGAHSMGNQGYSVPPGYLRRSGKCENIGDPGRGRGNCHWVSVIVLKG
jgi:hypothetical protein